MKQGNIENYFKKADPGKALEAAEKRPVDPIKKKGLKIDDDDDEEKPKGGVTNAIEESQNSEKKLKNAQSSLLQTPSSS